jgi:hypothetical protein
VDNKYTNYLFGAVHRSSRRRMRMGQAEGQCLCQYLWSLARRHRFVASKRHWRSLQTWLVNVVREGTASRRLLPVGRQGHLDDDARDIGDIRFGR